MKHISKALWVALLCGLLVAVLSACEGQKDPCKDGHSYVGEWSYDANNHWRAAACAHQKEITDKGVHSFDGNHCCTVCGYELSPAEGLRYTCNEDNTGYIVTGYDKPHASTVLVAKTYEGLPVIGIGENAFSNCTEPKTVILPSSITYIGTGAFYNCTELSEIRLPESVRAIGAISFWGCAKLGELSLPASLTELEYGAFYGCTALKTMTIPKGITKISPYVFYGCSGLTSVTMPAGVREIADHAFYNCLALENMNIPEGVVAIGACAFGNCTRLSTVTIPSGVVTIGASAFRCCTNLSSIIFLQTEGWRVSPNALPEGNGAAGVAIDVSDAAVNAEELTEDHVNYYWWRTDAAPQE